ncbi:MAG: HpcH/HpaI aldolase/citrate lyase family protein [Hyphomicrobiaceae bacterium]
MENQVDRFRPRRSVLYMPGANERALEKAKTLAADSLILDLEDAVAPEAKEMARAQVVAAVKAGGYGHREVVIRVNELDTPWSEADIAAAVRVVPDAILVPKVSSGDEVRQITDMLRSAGLNEATQLWVMIETPRAILEISEIAAASNDPVIPLTCLVLGTNDLAKETGASLSKDRFGVQSWLSMCVCAARAHGLHILDGVFNDFKDKEGFEAECRQGALLGMDGKTLIHPGQIAGANIVFSPKEREVIWARKVIEAFAQPENAGRGVITVDGQMVELLHAELAHKTVAVADAIDQLSAAET